MKPSITAALDKTHRAAKRYVTISSFVLNAVFAVAVFGAAYGLGSGLLKTADTGSYRPERFQQIASFSRAVTGEVALKEMPVPPANKAVRQASLIAPIPLPGHKPAVPQ